MDAKQIGEVIKEARKSKGKTQTALSAVLGIMPPPRAKRKPPSCALMP